MKRRESVKYWAFISYSSKDRKIAGWLHRKLEHYHLQTSENSATPISETISNKYLRPIFLDRDELPSCTDLGATITKALEASWSLVVICSPNSAKSKWVDKEIQDFRKIHGKQNILALIVDGIPNALSDPNIDDELECFPEALRFPYEPLAADIRKIGDSRQRGFLKIVSGLTNIEFDQLYRRHERQQRKKRLYLSSITAVIVSALAALTIFALGQKSRAEKEAILAKENSEKERKAKEDAQFLLSTMKKNLTYLNHGFIDQIRTYVPSKQRKELITQVKILTNTIQEFEDSPSPTDFQLIQQMATSLRNGAKQRSFNDPQKLHELREAEQMLDTGLESFPDELSLQEALLSCQREIGDLYLAQDKAQAAISVYSRGLNLAKMNNRMLINKKPNSAVDRIEILFGISIAYEEIGNQEKAVESLQRSINASKGFILYNQDNIDALNALYRARIRLGDLFSEKEQLYKASNSYRLALNNSKELLKKDDRSLEHQMNHAIVHWKIAKVDYEDSNPGIGRDSCQKAIQITQNLVKLAPHERVYSYHLSRCLSLLSKIQISSNFNDLAEEAGEAALATRKALAKNDNLKEAAVEAQELAKTRENLADIYRWNNKMQDSYRMMKIIEKSEPFQKDLFLQSRISRKFSYICPSLNRFEEGERYSRQSINAARALVGAKPRNQDYREECTYALVSLRILFERWKKFDESLKAGLDVIQFTEETTDRNPNSHKAFYEKTMAYYAQASILRKHDPAQTEQIRSHYRTALNTLTSKGSPARLHAPYFKTGHRLAEVLGTYEKLLKEKK